MKNINILLMVLVMQSGTLNGQKLPITEVFREKSNWHWAAASQCVLDYYGYPTEQCQMAEYIRTSGWYKPEERPCCDALNPDCNFSTELSEIEGSVQDILFRFGNIRSSLIQDSLTCYEIRNEINNGRPFIIRWEMPGQLSHYLVVYGIYKQDVLYLDPAAGEGLKMASYKWLKEDGHHIWTHTLIMSNMPTLINNDIYENIETAQLFPNPARDKVRICLNEPFSDQYEVEVYDVYGNLIFKQSQEKYLTAFDIEVSDYLPGTYIMHAFDKQNKFTYKIIKP